jgi:hypothetical protein
VPDANRHCRVDIHRRAASNLHANAYAATDSHPPSYGDPDLDPDAGRVRTRSATQRHGNFNFNVNCYCHSDCNSDLNTVGHPNADCYPVADQHAAAGR